MIVDAVALIVPQMKRFWREKRTYKTQMVLTMLSSIVGLVQFGILGMFISQGGSLPGLDAYGGNVIGFMVTGAMGSSVLFMLMNVPKDTIREEQRTGTLEMIIMSKLGLPTIIVTRLLVNLLSTLVSSTVVITCFFVIFHVSSNVNWLNLLLTVLVGFVLMSSIGLCAAGYILNSKSGEPFTWTMTVIVGLFSGVMFPVEFYPEWIQSLAFYIPTTSVMSALRLSTLTESNLFETCNVLIPAIVWICILLPLSLYVFCWGMRKSRISGTIGSY
ncbi:ABC transporter permease [Corynebacterium freiburgense]|uniref:ABC transporter permease n=1 Tax=Corynebacterium freiburgense TaxID=556548 RepID=UPI000426A3D8|nr:ABC transporter permease [Corynebacterium freiburgense]WJZ01869.1 ABC-2 type transporter [Corynebacterium freiburgense]